MTHIGLPLLVLHYLTLPRQLVTVAAAYFMRDFLEKNPLPIEQHILDTNAGKQQSKAATDV